MRHLVWITSLACLCSAVACSSGVTVQDDKPPIKITMAPDKPEAQSPAQTPTSPETNDVVRAVWTRLDQTTNACKETFDYHPGGGLQIFACHLMSLEPYERLSQLFPGKIFLKGPHSPNKLVLTSLDSFGHYNPVFVSWLVDHAIPASADASFRQVTQPLYDQYVKPLAHKFLVTLEKSEQEAVCFAAEVDAYEHMMQSGTPKQWYYERFFFFMNPSFCSNPNGDFAFFNKNGFSGGFDGNVIKTATAFWIRRQLDGTKEQFGRGLRLLVRTYEGQS